MGEANLRFARGEKEDAIKAARRRKRMEALSMEISLIVGIIMIFIIMGLLFTWIHFDKKNSFFFSAKCSLAIIP